MILKYVSINNLRAGCGTASSQTMFAKIWCMDGFVLNFPRAALLLGSREPEEISLPCRATVRKNRMQAEQMQVWEGYTPLFICYTSLVFLLQQTNNH